MGIVRRIVDFGAFVEILPGHRRPHPHLASSTHKRVNKVTDVLKEGDEVLVKVISHRPPGQDPPVAARKRSAQTPEHIHNSR